MKQCNQSFDADSRNSNPGTQGAKGKIAYGRVLGIILISMAVSLLGLLPSLRVLADPAPAFHSDDFNAPNLDTDLWTLIDPVGDGSIAIVGSGMGDAHLLLTAPGGTDHDPGRKNLSLRVMQAAENVDFEIEVKFDSLPEERYQLQGILVQANDRNWMRFGVYHDGETLWADAAVERNRNYKNRLKRQLPTLSDDSVYLKIRRSGNRWDFAYSDDGATWQEVGGLSNKIKVNSVGMYVGNRSAEKNGNEAPAYTSEVDYFLNPAEPLVREDNLPKKADRAPLIHGIQQKKTEGGIEVRWSTDELSVGILEYAKVSDTLPTALFSSASYNHVVEMTDIEIGVPYTYRINALDFHGNSSRTDETELLIPKPKTADVELHIWDGLNQAYGYPGNPQKWVNILGRVSPRGQTRSVTFSLNGSKSVRLRLGADGRRLVNSGDFNIEIPTSALQPGANVVEVVARDRRGGVARETVQVDWQPDQVWPLPYSVDWNELNTWEIQQVAQAVDGRWEIANGKLHIAKIGYDRLIAIGDTQWTDYQVEVPITIHKLNSRYGIGVVMRWNGHTDNPVRTRNPRSGWLPLGAIGWFHNGRLAISGNRWRVDPRQIYRPVAGGATYMFKMQVQTLENNRPRYRLKVWRQGKPEPQKWTVVARGRASDPKHGSLLLIAHKANASFGPVKITPLE